MPDSAFAIIYAEQLASQGFGHPLAYASAGTRFGTGVPLPEAQIGDVGIVSDGSFFRVFNAVHSKDDAINNNEVPEDFTQLQYDRRLRPGKRLCLDKGVYYRKGITSSTVQEDVGVTGSLGVDANISFEFTGHKYAGAALFLEDPAYKDGVLPNNAFRSYMRNNFEKWRAFSYGVDSDLVLVTGCIYTTRWKTSYCASEATVCEMTLQHAVDSTQSSSTATFKQARLSSPEFKMGPFDYDPSAP
ncbi:hypothetical protein EUX98_g9684, partial [Antrodiella citrinella]